MIIPDEAVRKKIVYHRHLRNLTREELASNVGIKLNRLIRIETGQRRPRMNEIVQLAVGLDISVDELV